jgi:hypothetical protein
MQSPYCDANYANKSKKCHVQSPTRFWRLYALVSIKGEPTRAYNLAHRYVMFMNT